MLVGRRAEQENWETNSEKEGREHNERKLYEFSGDNLIRRRERGTSRYRAPPSNALGTGRRKKRWQGNIVPATDSKLLRDLRDWDKYPNRSHRRSEEKKSQEKNQVNKKLT